MRAKGVAASFNGSTEPWMSHHDFDARYSYPDGAATAISAEELKLPSAIPAHTTDFDGLARIRSQSEYFASTSVLRY